MVVLVAGCGKIAGDAVVDAGDAASDAAPVSDAGPTTCDSGCELGLAAFCANAQCPPSLASANPSCSGTNYIRQCGGDTVVGFFGVDTGYEYVFDADGGLIFVESDFNGTTKCAQRSCAFSPSDLSNCVDECFDASGADAGPEGG